VVQVSHDGHVQRCLHESATAISRLRSGQRTRARPSCGSPHFRKAVMERSTIGRQKPNVRLRFSLGRQTLLSIAAWARYTNWGSAFHALRA